MREPILTFIYEDNTHMPLSNFYRVPVAYAGAMWATAEHAYQAAKTRDHTWKMKILDAPTPGQAKRLGRQVPMREDWDVVKIAVMHEILQAKFHAGDWPGPWLVQTGDAYLVEGNNWGDRFWGQVQGAGENWLGRLLMLRRSELILQGVE